MATEYQAFHNFIHSLVLCAYVCIYYIYGISKNASQIKTLQCAWEQTAQFEDFHGAIRWWQLSIDLSLSADGSPSHQLANLSFDFKSLCDLFEFYQMWNSNRQLENLLTLTLRNLDDSAGTQDVSPCRQQAVLNSDLLEMILLRALSAGWSLYLFQPPLSLCCHQSDSLQSCVISDRILRENTFEHLLKAMLVPSPGSHLDVLYSLSERQKCCILWLADFFWFIGYGFMWFSVLILVVFRGAILGGF